MINESHTLQGRGVVVSTGAFQWQQLQICSWLYLSVSYSRFASCKQNIIKPALCITLTQQKDGWPAYRKLFSSVYCFSFCCPFLKSLLHKFLLRTTETHKNLSLNLVVSNLECFWNNQHNVFLNGIWQNHPKIQFRIASVSYFRWHSKVRHILSSNPHLAPLLNHYA